jgi:hypothetical protein
MLIINHRINTIEGLKATPRRYGVEVDLRADGDRVVMHHDPFKGGEDFEAWLEHYHHAFIILNTKTTGIEDRVVAMCEARGIHDYFLLDVEFPYIYKKLVMKKSPVTSKIAIRYSEAEPIENTLQFRGLADWVWIDVNTRLPLDAKAIEQLRGFKTCLVSPECWGRPQDVQPFMDQMRALNFVPDAVMPDGPFLEAWEAWGQG